jgi:hypothetical protein
MCSIHSIDLIFSDCLPILSMYVFVFNPFVKPPWSFHSLSMLVCMWSLLIHLWSWPDPSHTVLPILSMYIFVSDLFVKLTWLSAHLQRVCLWSICVDLNFSYCLPILSLYVVVLDLSVKLTCSITLSSHPQNVCGFLIHPWSWLNMPYYLPILRMYGVVSDPSVKSTWSSYVVCPFSACM